MRERTEVTDRIEWFANNLSGIIQAEKILYLEGKRERFDLCSLIEWANNNCPAVPEINRTSSDPLIADTERRLAIAAERERIVAKIGLVKVTPTHHQHHVIWNDALDAAIEIVKGGEDETN